jgi:type II secretory pathway pseudopilin PulG
MISRRARAAGQGAFSLIEIVLAIGVISFALVGILGLFPVALDAATSSQRETQAVLLARTIFSDLKSTTATNTYLVKKKDFKPDANSPDDLIKVNLSIPGTYVLAYDMDGVPLGEYAGKFDAGVPNSAFLAQVDVTTNNLPLGSSAISITVGVPGAAAKKHRQSYSFVSYMDNGETNTNR